MGADIFESEVRADGAMAGVFEFEGDAGYFYLYDTKAQGGHKVLDAIHVVSGTPDFSQADVLVRWDASGRKVGLLIRGVLWAVFDVEGREKHGGNYRAGSSPRLPSNLCFVPEEPGR